MTFVRVTVQPMYLAPVEEALSDLAAGHAGRAVRYGRARAAADGGAVGGVRRPGSGAGFLTLEQIDRWEGWQRRGAADPAALAPTPRRSSRPTAAVAGSG